MFKTERVRPYVMSLSGNVGLNWLLHLLPVSKLHNIVQGIGIYHAVCYPPKHPTWTGCLITRCATKFVHVHPGKFIPTNFTPHLSETSISTLG